VPGRRDGRLVAQLVMVGNAGPQMHAHFTSAPEAADGLPHPLDRWTRRIVDGLAAELGAEAIYPFQGPPWFPFQRWARHADPDLHPSPTGILIHPVFGLWHALRAALLLANPVELPPSLLAASPCEACAAKPCLTSCPVGAIRHDSYRVADCRALLATLSGQSCMMLGCAARRACPVGREHAYAAGQAAFHMRAFRTA
jgi:ferredoxin